MGDVNGGNAPSGWEKGLVWVKMKKGVGRLRGVWGSLYSQNLAPSYIMGNEVWMDVFGWRD